MYFRYGHRYITMPAGLVCLINQTSGPVSIWKNVAAVSNTSVTGSTYIYRDPPGWRSDHAAQAYCRISSYSTFGVNLKSFKFN